MAFLWLTEDTTAEGTTEGAGDRMVFVTYTETYDLSTKRNQLGFIGVHTPSISSLVQLYQGLFENHKFYRIHSCNVTMACASMLPADPLQIGVEAGDIAPQDMFNPILYKACSNDSWDVVASRIYQEVNSSVGAVTSSITKVDDPFSGVSPAIDDFALYYAFLAEDGWRKAMPQSGLSVRGLYPLVYPMLQQYGNINLGASGTPTIYNEPTVNSSGQVVQSNRANVFKGSAQRMPRLPTHQAPSSDAVNGNASFYPTPTTYVLMLITPPAKLNILYYRMRISWTIEFQDVCTTAEAASTLSWYLAQGAATYGTDYASSSKVMENKDEVVDTYGTTLDHVMTSGK